MNVFKKTVTLAAAVSLVCLSSAGAMAANKLIVKDSTGVTDKFVVTDAGFIGVGTSTPTYSLHMVGAGASSLSSMFFANNGRATGKTIADAPAMVLFRNNDSSINSGMPEVGDRLGSFSFGSVVGGTNRYLGNFTVAAESTFTASSAPTYISIQTTSSGSVTASERIRIASSGNIGIGNSAPASKLDVYGGIRINTPVALTQPTCTSAIRGTFWVVQGTTDALQVCATVSGGYVWRNVTLN